jgi:hypothetical protein
MFGFLALFAVPRHLNDFGKFVAEARQLIDQFLAGRSTCAWAWLFSRARLRRLLRIGSFVRCLLVGHLFRLLK